MKYSIATLLGICISLISFAQENQVVFNGVYSGQNVYVKNSKISDNGEFCILEVSVNGQITDDVLNSTAFSISLEEMGLEIADSLTIVIKHKEDCEPSLINPEVISPASTFEIEDILLSRDGTLQWTTINEGGELPFIIEQFKWNKWVEIGAVRGHGGKELNKYSYDVQMHYGNNTVRIKQKDRSVEHASKKISAESLREEPVMLLNSNIKKVLEFSEETAFELFNQYGEIVLSETLQSADISKLEKGVYYLNYGNNFGIEIQKK